MARPIFACIDPAAFRHNYLVAKRAAPTARAWAVIKANAYGHGAMVCAQALRGIADGYALLEVSEALALRHAGFSQPILLLEGAFGSDDVIAAANHALCLVVHEASQLRMLELAELDTPVDIYLKLNSGMNRLGFAPADFAAALGRAQACANIGQITLMTHFAQADGAGIDAQSAVFAAATEGLDLPRSLANSAALLRFCAAQADWVRPGIMLYGGSPMPQFASSEALGLQPVMSLMSKIISVQNILPGQAVGYGATFVADRPMRVGTVACGYADGYPRHAGTGTPILVEGARTRTLGRVSMDMLSCDLTDLPASGLGASVTLWGRGLPADEVAAAAGTISYELFCALAPRVPMLTCGGALGQS